MRFNKFLNGLLALVCLAGVGMAPLCAEEAAPAPAAAAGDDFTVDFVRVYDIVK